MESQKRGACQIVGTRRAHRSLDSMATAVEQRWGQTAPFGLTDGERSHKTKKEALDSPIRPRLSASTDIVAIQPAEEIDGANPRTYNDGPSLLDETRGRRQNDSTCRMCCSEEDSPEVPSGNDSAQIIPRFRMFLTMPC